LKLIGELTKGMNLGRSDYRKTCKGNLYLPENPTIGRFVEQEQSLRSQRIVLIDRISSLYFLIALINAIKKNNIHPPEELMTQAEIRARTGNAWFISIGGNNLMECKQ